MDVTILVCTFGSDKWLNMGSSKAESLRNKFDYPVLHHHGEDIQSARNDAVAKAKSEWICIVDADDNLKLGYFDAMAKYEDDYDLLAPAVRRISNSGRTQKVEYMGRWNIKNGNPCCIGTLFRKSYWEKVDGFSDLPILEDWDFFRRCYFSGARLKCVDEAQYLYYIMPDSRNSDEKLRRKIANKIRKDYYVD